MAGLCLGYVLGQGIFTSSLSGHFRVLHHLASPGGACLNSALLLLRSQLLPAFLGGLCPQQRDCEMTHVCLNREQKTTRECVLIVWRLLSSTPFLCRRLWTGFPDFVNCWETLGHFSG